MAKGLTGPKFVNNIRDPMVAFIFEEMWCRGISLNRMAKFSGVSTHTLSDWRRERHTPHLANYLAVLNALDYELAVIAKINPATVRVIRKGISGEKISCS